MNSVSSLVYIALSFSIILCYSGSLYYNIQYVTNEGQNIWNQGGFGGKFRYLTFLDMWVQTIYWVVAMLAGISTLSYGMREGKLHRLVDYMHSSLAFPAGMFVTIMFWMIYAVDRELVYPKRLDAFIPLWLNHVMHTVHLPFLLLDKYLVPHRYPKFFSGISITLTFSVLYQFWVLYLAFEHSIWVYPILAVMTWPFRLAFFALNWTFMILMYKTGDMITLRLWGKRNLRREKLT